MKLRKFLIPFLLCSVLCFSFIPKTHAASTNQFDMLFSANIYNTQGNFSTEILDGDHLSIYGGFPVFFGFQIADLYISKACGHSYTYRIDYDIWGYHNPNVNWVEYAQLIKLNGTNVNTIGTIIKEENIYNLKFSTFFTWTPDYCPVDSIPTFRFDVSDYLRDPINTNFFYNQDYSSARTNYYIYEKLIGDIDSSVATQLVANYYGGGQDYKQELDQIKGEIVHVNDKLEETNEKLEDIYNTLTDSSLDTGNLENSAGWLPPGPVDSILNLPLSLYQNLLETLQTNQRACPALNINLPYLNEVLVVPCLTDIFNQIDGLNVFWTWVGTIAGAFILFNYLINLYKWVDATLTMRENNHFGGY